MSQVRCSNKFRMGDWVCVRCKNFNFSFRVICNRCKLEKPFTETQDFDGFSSALFVPVSSNSHDSS